MLVSTASLVVPAISETISLFSPISLLIKDDLPTLGFPIIATFVISSSSSSSLGSGKKETTSSRRSPIPNWLAEDIGCGSPIPKL